MSRDGVFAVGVLIGGILMLTICFTFSLMPTSLIHKAELALATCEETLPRNQQCVITARPEE